MCDIQCHGEKLAIERAKGAMRLSTEGQAETRGNKWINPCRGKADGHYFKTRQVCSSTPLIVSGGEMYKVRREGEEERKPA